MSFMITFTFCIRKSSPLRWTDNQIFNEKWWKRTEIKSFPTMLIKDIRSEENNTKKKRQICWIFYSFMTVLFCILYTITHTHTFLTQPNRKQHSQAQFSMRIRTHKKFPIKHTLTIATV